LYGVEKVLETLQYGPAMGIQELQPDRFSAPPTITSISSDQFTFPLIRRTVSNYTLPRLALVGDAAHSVHPMAGQGLNLGLQDVDDLVRVITKATDAGMDVSSFLHDYESSRHQQVSLTVGGIHALQQLFHVQSVWAKHVKSMGMNVIQGVGPLRQRLVQAACLGVSSPIS
jgi:2-polyprenyl-6-methoxyphenol hydroxylase-like FAD-dependent oxidoreductase